MEYETFLIAKSLIEEIRELESHINVQQKLIDEADECMRGTEDEKIILNLIHELHDELAELKVKFSRL